MSGLAAGVAGFGLPASQAAAGERRGGPFDPDLVVFNARVWTGNRLRPKAQAFAVKDGVFIAVGKTEHIRRLASRRTRVVDAEGAYIVPGMIDTHNHGDGQRSLFRALVGNPFTIESFSVSRIIDILREEEPKVPAGHWVDGHFFDDTKVDGGEDLRKEHLDRVSTEKPVRVLHRGGHTTWYNSVAF